MKMKFFAAMIATFLPFSALAEDSGVAQAYQQVLSAKIGQEMTISLNCQAAQIVDKKLIVDLERRVKELEAISGNSDSKIQEVK
jgi:phosphoribosyl-dephospho-CoA transferase